MTIEIITASAGTNFAFREGQIVSDIDCENKEFLQDWVDILKEQVRCEHANDITGTPKAQALEAAKSAKIEKAKAEAIAAEKAAKEAETADSEAETAVIEKKVKATGIEKR